MTPLVPAAVALAVFALAHRATARLCTAGARVHLLDRPNERSLHTVPTPRTGGVAIVAASSAGLGGLLVAAHLGWLGDGLRAPLAGSEGRALAWILGACIVMAVVSFGDDITPLPISVRLGTQMLTATAVVLGGGVRIDRVPLPLAWQGLLPPVLAILVTILTVVWLSNLYNFMDGMDGFAGGMTVVGFSVLGMISWRGGAPLLATAMIAVAAAGAGFLLHNRPPARIFMGDVGSVTVGFLAGSLGAVGVSRGLFDVWVPVLVFSPFIVDATFTLVRRAVRGERVWHAHREHLYQRLVLQGWSHRRTVGVQYAFMLASAAAATAYLAGGALVRLGVLLFVAAGYAAYALAVARLERRSALPVAVRSGRRVDREA